MPSLGQFIVQPRKTEAACQVTGPLVGSGETAPGSLDLPAPSLLGPPVSQREDKCTQEVLLATKLLVQML